MCAACRHSLLRTWPDRSDRSVMEARGPQTCEPTEASQSNSESTVWVNAASRRGSLESSSNSLSKASLGYETMAARATKCRTSSLSLSKPWKSKSDVAGFARMLATNESMPVSNEAARARQLQPTETHRESEKALNLQTDSKTKETCPTMFVIWAAVSDTSRFPPFHCNRNSVARMFAASCSTPRDVHSSYKCSGAGSSSSGTKRKRSCSHPPKCLCRRSADFLSASMTRKQSFRTSVFPICA